MYKLELVNKKTKEVTIFDDLADINYGEKLFFNFEINATQLADGEYTLSLYDDGKLIVTDTLCVGDFDVVGLQYKKGEAIYIATELESKTQDKSVEVSDINTTIIPDVGYDAMTTVQVNAQPVYDGAYNAGHTEGYESGIVDGIEQGREYQKEQLTNIEITSNGTYERTDGYNKVDVSVSEIDFTVIGYDTEANNEVNTLLKSHLNYSKQLYDAWSPSQTISSTQYYNDTTLVYAPQIDTSNVRDMNQMYYGCSQLQYVPKLNTSKVTNMNNMFCKCSSLKTIPMFDTTNVTGMSSMFDGCEELINIPSLNTSNVKNMKYMFRDCISLTSVPLLDTSSVTDMTEMFDGCENLKTIPMFDTSNVTSMASTFYSCKYLTSFPELNTSNVKDASGMFGYCSSLTTIPQLDFSNVTNVYRLFNYCTNLNSIPLLDFGNVTNINEFFGRTGTTSNLRNLGGFKNLKIDWNDNYGLYKCSSITYESIMNVISNLYDFRANGDSSTTKTLKIHKTTMALLSDNDKALATSKGWVLTS